MTLAVQNDEGTVDGANGYITVSFFRDYHTARGTDTSEHNDTTVGEAIVGATDYMDFRFRYVGKALAGRDQTTDWPRQATDSPNEDDEVVGVSDSDGNEVTGIPREIKEACAEYALRALSSPLFPDPAVDSTGAVVQSSTKRVGPITKSVSYFTAAGFIYRKYPAADKRLINSGFVLYGSRIRIWG